MIIPAARFIEYSLPLSQVLDFEPEESTEREERGKSRKKILPATYEPDKRTLAWLKLKKDYVSSIGDSLDVVPIGAWYGNGRKAGWWSPILLGLWDADAGRAVAVCKCMSGSWRLHSSFRALVTD